VAVPASASVQNIKISGSVDSTFVHRKNFDLGLSVRDESQSLFITQSTLQVDADLTDQVSATIGLLNERVWEQDVSTSDHTDLDIYLAYVTLREMLYSPLTLVIGRQVFSYGNSLVMDATGTNNQVGGGDSGLDNIAEDLTIATSLDAFRAILDYNPLTVEIVYAVIDPGTVTLANTDDAIYLVGANATYELGDDMGSVVEAYLWNKENESVKIGNTGAKADVIKVIGLRGSTNPIEGLNVQLEWAHQGGVRTLNNASAVVNQTRNAYALQAIVNYQIPMFEEYKPTAQYVFTKVSGNSKKEADAGVDYKAWDPFFEAQGGGTIYNAIFDLSDLVIHSVSFSATPMEDVTVKSSLHSLWRESGCSESRCDTITLRSPDGGTVGYTGNSSTGGHLGKEFDLDITYDYTEDVQIGASLGFFHAGSVFEEVNEDTAKQLLVNLNVAF